MDSDISTLLSSFIPHKKILGPAKATIFERNRISIFVLLLIKICSTFQLYTPVSILFHIKGIIKFYVLFFSFIKKNNLNLKYVKNLVQAGNIPISDIQFLVKNKIAGVTPWPRFEETYYRCWYKESSSKTDWDMALESYWRENIEANLYCRDETFSRHTLSTNLSEAGLIITKRIIQNKDSRKIVNWIDYGSGLGIIPTATSNKFQDFKIIATDIQDNILKNSHLKKLPDSKVKMSLNHKITNCDFFSSFEVIEHLYSLEEIRITIDRANPKVILISCPLDEPIPDQPAIEHLWSFTKEGLIAFFDRLGYSKVSHVSLELLEYRKTQILLLVKKEFRHFAIGVSHEGSDNLKLTF